MECQSDGLPPGRPYAQLGAMHRDTRTNKVGEGRELSANQVPGLHPSPFVPNESFLIGRKRLDALTEALHELSGISGWQSGGRLPAQERACSAMIHLACDEVLSLRVLLAFGCRGSSQAQMSRLRTRRGQCGSRPRYPVPRRVVWVSSPYQLSPWRICASIRLCDCRRGGPQNPRVAPIFIKEIVSRARDSSRQCRGRRSATRKSHRAAGSEGRLGAGANARCLQT
jgi:hypothetical protein